MSENKSKKELEKEIFKFSALRVWGDIFPVVLDLEKALEDKPDEHKAKLLTMAQDLLEHLVSGYYKFHLVDKYLAYARAKEDTALVLLLVYRLGFRGVLAKEKVLDFGARLAECVKLMSSLIRNLENKMKRMDEAKWLSERLKNER